MIDLNNYYKSMYLIKKLLIVCCHSTDLINFDAAALIIDYWMWLTKSFVFCFLFFLLWFHSIVPYLILLDTF